MSSPHTDQARWIAEEIQPHEPSVRGYLRNQFPTIDADDVVQESYLMLLRIMGERRITSSKAYFFAVARNIARRLFRRRKLYSDTSVNELPDSCLMDGEQDAAETIHTHQMRGYVVEAIDRLPPRCGVILGLAALQGYSNAAIAKELGLSENTVRVQIARGIKKCAAHLREYHDDV
jgi:RNA polymerase sigma factor (sigma-70 family)